MKKTWLIVIREIKTSLQRRTYLFFAFVLPLLVGLVALILMLRNRESVAAPAPSPAAGVRKGIVRQAGALPDTLNPWGQEVLHPFNDEATAAAALGEGTIDGYYLVAADYIQSGDVLYMTHRFNPLEDNAGSESLAELLLIDLLGNAQLASLVASPLIVTERPLNVSATSGGKSWINDLLPLLTVVILYMTVTMTTGNLVNAVTDEKKNRVLEVLLASASPRQLIGGKMLAMGLLGLLQMVTWIGIFWAVVRFGGQPLQIPPGFSIPTDLLLWMALYSLLAYAIYGGLMAGLGALAPDVKDTRSLSFLLQLPLILGYMAAFFILEAPDAPLTIVVSVFPLTAPPAMIGRLAAGNVPLWQPLLAAVLQLLTGIAIVLLVARMFRAQVLLSGEPVSAGRYFRVLLAAR